MPAADDGAAEQAPTGPRADAAGADALLRVSGDNARVARIAVAAMITMEATARGARRAFGSRRLPTASVRVARVERRSLACRAMPAGGVLRRVGLPAARTGMGMAAVRGL